jgi:hypothetical protein
MSCCGKGRSQLNATSNLMAGRPTAVVFEYIGRTRVSVIGPATRTSYRFDHPGARVLVDRRDRASLSAIPLLRQVTN